ncbi:MAG TPA: hypothetical protein VE981_12300 [Planctomycetota bacterium]|nr:hypothetical protein [Planctomycetota bacterium]
MRRRSALALLLVFGVSVLHPLLSVGELWPDAAGASLTRTAPDGSDADRHRDLGKELVARKSPGEFVAAGPKRSPFEPQRRASLAMDSSSLPDVSPGRIRCVEPAVPVCRSVRLPAAPHGLRAPPV